MWCHGAGVRGGGTGKEKEVQPIQVGPCCRRQAVWALRNDSHSRERREAYVHWMPSPMGSLYTSGWHMCGLRILCPWGGRRPETHGMGGRQDAVGLCLHNAYQSPHPAGHCSAGQKWERRGPEELSWYRGSFPIPPRPGQAARYSVSGMRCHDSVTFWLFCSSRKEKHKLNFQQASFYKLVTI